MRNSTASRTLAAAVALDVTGGLVFSLVEHVPAGIGLYWALTTATTVGYGDVTPKTTAGHIVATIVMLTVVPLFAATYALITTGLTARHVSAETSRVRDRLDHVIHHHPSIPEFDDS